MALICVTEQSQQPPICLTIPYGCPPTAGREGPLGSWGSASPYLGDVLSFLDTLRWKMEGARHTARFPAVIWFSSAEAMSLRK